MYPPIRRIFVQLQNGTDQFELVLEYVEGVQRVFNQTYSTQEAAAEYAQAIAEQEADDGNRDCQIVGLPASMGGKTIWHVEEWLRDSALEDVTATMDDDDLWQLVTEYEAVAEEHGIALQGDIFYYLSYVRQKKAGEL